MKRIAELKEKLSGLKEIKRIGVVAAHDEHALEAALIAAREKLVFPVLLGEKDKILEMLKRFGFSADQVEIEDINSSEECAKRAAELVRKKELDCILKGKIETGVLMKVMVDREHGIRQSGTISSIGIYESPYYHKVFAVTDSGMLMYPTLEQKKDLTISAVKAFHALGTEKPKVGVLAAVEQVNPKMKESVEAGELKKMWQNRDIPGCWLEGPISYDLAMEKGAAELKGYESPVAGDADILVVPDICSGNILYKSLMCTGGAKTAGTIIGGMVPISFTSRSASAEAKYNSILLSAAIGNVFS